MGQIDKISAILKSAMLLLVIGVLSATAVHAQEKLKWLNFEQAISQADSTKKPVFIDVWAPWCGWCRKMKQEVYPVLESQLSGKFILTRLNRDDNKTEYRYKDQRYTSLQLAQALHTESVPAIVLLDSTGEYLLHLSGFVKPEKLRSILDYIGTGAYQSMRFEEFMQRKHDKDDFSSSAIVI